VLRGADANDARGAAAIVGAVLDSPEIEAGHPHQGDFRWLVDDPEVVELDAVQFVLRKPLPLLVQYADRLPTALLQCCRAALELTLAEEARLEVAPTYTNIHLVSLLALVAGGEWLSDTHLLALGRERWARFRGKPGGP